MSDLTTWTRSLPQDLAQELLSLVERVPESGPVLTRLFQVLVPSNGHVPMPPTTQPNKRHHPDVTTPVLGDVTGPVRILEPVLPTTVIFEIQQVLFQSPVRKKLNLTFHLVEQNGVPVPVLSIVNPSTLIPEASIINLTKAVKTCLLLPILGNLTNSQKKNVVTFCLWVKDLCIDTFSPLSDPIVCSLNLDLIRKQMVKSGKLPPNLDHLNHDPSADTSSHNLNPLVGRLVDYFQRQFKLCGITLVNALPCNGNAMLLNSDSVVQIRSPDEASFVLVEAHNRAKDGSLIFVSLPGSLPFVIFGFKKPTLFFDAHRIKLVQYSSITRNTFSLLITVMTGNQEEIIEFGMIDEPVFSVIDEFVKQHNINDDSFNEVLREKPTALSAIAITESGAANAPGLLASIQTDQQEDESDDESYHEGAENGSDMLEGESDSDIDDLDVTENEDLTEGAIIEEETLDDAPSLASGFVPIHPAEAPVPDADSVFSTTIEVEELA